MSGCFDSNTSSLVFGDIPPSDTICSGHGICTDSTCVCNSMWTGASDFLNFDTYDCVNFVPVDRLVWAIVLLRWMNTMWIWHHAHTNVLKRFRKKKKIPFVRLFREKAAIKTLFLNTYIIAPLWFVVCAAKLAGQTFVNDTLLTYAYSLLNLIGYASVIPVQVQITRSALECLMISERKKVKHVMKRFEAIQYFNALGVLCIPQVLLGLVALYTPQGYPRVGDLKTRLYFASSAMNFPAVLIQAALYRYVNHLVVKHNQVWTHLVSEGSNKSAKQKDRDVEITRKLEQMRILTDGASKGLLSAFPLICLQVVPRLWAYQTYVTAYIAFIIVDKKVNVCHLFLANSPKKTNKVNVDMTIKSSASAFESVSTVNQSMPI